MEKYKPNELKSIAKFLGERNFSAHFIIPKDVCELAPPKGENNGSNDLNEEKKSKDRVGGVIVGVNPAEWEY